MDRSSNKLGISEYRLREIEKEIINLKLRLLNSYYTFNNTKYDLTFLIRLNSFLFSDFYFKDERGTRDLSIKEKELIESKLEKISYLCLNNPNELKEILLLIEEIWHLQPFIVGNTRTLVALIKILNESFLLGLNVDINQNITNNPKIFKLNNFVNQKGLTK